MLPVRISELAGLVGKEVTIQGWLHNKRSSGKLHFLEVRDGSGIVQCVVFKGNVDEDTFVRADKIEAESSVEITGNVKEHGKIKGTYEIDVKTVRVLAASRGEYPINAKKLAGDVFTTDFLMDHRHLWL